MNAVITAKDNIGVTAACDALSLPRATYYRRLNPSPQKPRPKPKRALSDQERQEVLEKLHEPEYVDKPPAQVVATQDARLPRTGQNTAEVDPVRLQRQAGPHQGRNTPQQQHRQRQAEAKRATRKTPSRNRRAHDPSILIRGSTQA